MRSIAIAAALGAALVAGPVAAGFFGDAGRPLERLARLVPREAGLGEGDILFMSDIAASAREMSAFAFRGDRLAGGNARFVVPTASGGFDQSLLLMSEDHFEGVLGFPITEIRQMAGWGVPPLAPVVMLGVPGGDGIAAMDAALRARDFETSERSGVTVWHRQDDFEHNLRRRMEEPFNGGIGFAERFAVRGDALLFARTWPMIERLIDGGPDLTQDADAAAVIAAAHAQEDRGSLIQMTFLGAQRPRMWPEGSGAPPDAGLPGLPPYRRHALILWQDGTRMTGAVAIPYGDPGTGELALARFEAIFPRAASALSERPFAELLPPPEPRLVGAEGRTVLLILFEDVIDMQDDPGPLAFLRNPYRRLLQMVYALDIDNLIGAR